MSAREILYLMFLQATETTQRLTVQNVVVQCSLVKEMLLPPSGEVRKTKVITTAYEIKGELNDAL